MSQRTGLRRRSRCRCRRVRCRAIPSPWVSNFQRPYRRTRMGIEATASCSIRDHRVLASGSRGVGVRSWSRRSAGLMLSGMTNDDDMVASERESELRAQAEEEWLDRWTAGPTEGEGDALSTGSPAPDLSLLDHTGRQRRLSEFWSGQPALLMFWRHFGCPCGFDRAERLRSEVDGYLAAGMQPVIIGQGEPVRAAAYRAEHEIPCAILCDPDHDAYRAYGIGHWNIERVLPDAPRSIGPTRRRSARTSRPRSERRATPSSTTRGERSGRWWSARTGASASPTRTSTARTSLIRGCSPRRLG